MKREIEKRGWGWISHYSSMYNLHVFTIYPDPFQFRGKGDEEVEMRDNNEFRAGCIAYLRVIEGIGGSKDE